MVKKQTLQPLLDCITSQQPISAHRLSLQLGRSRALVHRYLLVAQESGLVTKHGTFPRIFYTCTMQTLTGSVTMLSYTEHHFLDENFLTFDVNGRELIGAQGFADRCQQRGFSVSQHYKLFFEMRTMVHQKRDESGLINTGYKKFCQQVQDPYLDDLLYCDVYQLGHFGKSKLANLAFFAKQQQSKELMDRVGKLTKPQILSHIATHQYDAICYIPPSVMRKRQLLSHLSVYRGITLPEIKLQKLSQGTIIVPQKSIKGIAQRIRNVRETMYVIPNQRQINSLLLIDDFVGSGATLNESARKLRDAGVAKHIVGLALVGNIDLSYEVINEL